MLRRSFLRARLFKATPSLLCSHEGPSLKEKVTEKLRKEGEAFSQVACYPHRSLTRPVLTVSEKEILAPSFITRILRLKQLAKELNCVSFSAPKAHWDAAVVLLKSSPLQEDFDVWVNPTVPGYDDRNSVAPMYGMWENCISCGSANAWILRPQQITCNGFDDMAKPKEVVLSGLSARCLMHELDHLSGKTIFQQAVGAEFVVSTVSMAQKDQWPANFPSAEAYVTGSGEFFDYVTNRSIIPPGMELWHMSNAMQHFQDARLGAS